MLKEKQGLKVGLMVGLMSLMATPAFARSISLKDAGTTLWIFIIIGALIVLLQLIPAAILFFSFIGTATTVALKKERKLKKRSWFRGRASGGQEMINKGSKKSAERKRVQCQKR